MWNWGKSTSHSNQTETIWWDSTHLIRLHYWNISLWLLKLINCRVTYNIQEKELSLKDTHERLRLTFHLQDQIRGGGVSDEALWGDAKEVSLVVLLRCEAHTASCHGHTATGTQAALLQQLRTQLIASSVTFKNIFWELCQCFKLSTKYILLESCTSYIYRLNIKYGRYVFYASLCLNFCNWGLTDGIYLVLRSVVWKFSFSL